MKTRLATFDDLNQLMKHYEYLIDQMSVGPFPTKWKKGVYPIKEDIHEHIENNNMYIIENHQTIIASWAMNHHFDEAYTTLKWHEAKDHEISIIHILAVNPDYQNQGFAKKAMKEAIGIAKKKHQKVIRLDTLLDNIPAQHAYVSVGFEERGNIIQCFDNTGRAEFKCYEYII